MAYALATRLERAVKNAGVKYNKASGWASHGRGTMGAIKTIVCHHTAGPKSGNSPSLNVVRNGRPGLNGPLAQLFLARDGTVTIVGAGIANHAGVVRASSYSNSHAIGIEAENTGLSNDPWPAHQIDAYAKLCKALCKEFGLSTSRVLGHKEVCAPVGRKPDPSFSMADFRKKVGGAKGGVSSGGGTGGGVKRYESASAKHTVGSRVMGLYDGGTDVLWLQKQLGVKPADSLFGPSTKKAVEAYQRSRNLTVDGLAGKATIGALQGSKAPAKPKPAPKHNPKAPAFPLPKGHWMGVESSNPKNHSGYHAKDRPGIKLWQARMKARGWSIGVDGRFGPQSERVAKQFQKQVRVAQDGLVGAVTFEKAWSAPVT